ncbi:MAG TPA: 4-alpha-glucanotransferase [Xanthomonadaceae bacterium]|nr:4-alpha-glucanotransferase [Xanthomonadaceae bacterium]
MSLLASTLFLQRRTGVLLHPTALHGEPGEGPLGQPGITFLDFLAAARVGVWQMLPIHPVHADLSPYQPLSLFAGGEHLMCLRSFGPQARRSAGAAPARGQARTVRREALALIEAGNAETAAFEGYCARERHWLKAYAAFRLLRARHHGRAWPDWPADWRASARDAIARLEREAPTDLAVEQAVQFLFERQWQALHAAAAARGVLLFGDLPMYPALDSAEVWAQPHLFRIDHAGRPLEAGGAPPDAFNRDGQRWGGAVYDWQAIADDGYRWWCARLERQSRLFDLLRLDHFRGFQAWWSIPAEATSAAAGCWNPGPGRALFERLAEVPGLKPLVAEDLGDITPEVEGLRVELGLPGTRVLQFAFDGNPDNPHLPQNYGEDTAAYTGTHDNDTTLGWWCGQDEDTRSRVRAWVGEGAMPWPLIRVLFESRAALAVLPMQDVLALGGEARFNVPGTVGGNWIWRMPANMLDPAVVARLGEMVAASRRGIGTLPTAHSQHTGGASVGQTPEAGEP